METVFDGKILFDEEDDSFFESHYVKITMDTVPCKPCIADAGGGGDGGEIRLYTERVFESIADRNYRRNGPQPNMTQRSQSLSAQSESEYYCTCSRDEVNCPAIGIYSRLGKASEILTLGCLERKLSELADRNEKYQKSEEKRIAELEARGVKPLSLSKSKKK